jgi:hypothetical protein
MIFTPKTLAFFNHYLNQYDTNYMEIGVYYGQSIKELSENFPNKLIIAIDPFIEDGNTSHHSNVQFGQPLTLPKANVLSFLSSHKNIKLFETTSVEFYKTLTEKQIQELNIGCFFIDGSHHYPDVANDYMLCLAMLQSKKGIICFDDLHLKDVQRAYNEFINIASSRISKIVDVSEISKAVILNTIN